MINYSSGDLGVYFKSCKCDSIGLIKCVDILIPSITQNIVGQSIIKGLKSKLTPNLIRVVDVK